MLLLKQRFAGAELAYWHDLGHGQLRENIGLCRHLESARTLLPFTRGIHIHDASPLMHDHLPPGQGSIDFPALSFYGTGDIIRVFEPSPQVEFADLRVALQYVRQAWDG